MSPQNFWIFAPLPLRADVLNGWPLFDFLSHSLWMFVIDSSPLFQDNYSTEQLKEIVVSLMRVAAAAVRV